MIRLMIAALALVTGQAFAETVISFDDGSTYTLTGGQEIFISTSSSPLFKRKVFSNKNTYFLAQKPWAKRDYVPQPQDEYGVGSHEWCQAYIPWSEGLSFDMITWQKACDTNGDNVYDENDDRWPG